MNDHNLPTTALSPFPFYYANWRTSAIATAFPFSIFSLRIFLWPLVLTAAAYCCCRYSHILRRNRNSTPSELQAKPKPRHFPLRFFLFPLLSALLIISCSPEKKPLSITFTGDLLLDRGVREYIARKGIDSLFFKIKPVLTLADFTVANLECPATSLEAPINKMYIFRAEPEWLQALKSAGITHLVMANNHTNDQGRAGIVDTYYNILKAGLVPVGYGSNQAGACDPVIIEKNNIRVALFASVLVPLETWAYLPDSAGQCQSTVPELAERISAHKKKFPADKIVVVLHWGQEFQPSPAIQQRVQAAALVDAGADAIIGHHPHVIQDVEYYRGKPVFFSLGNFVFDRRTPATQKGLLVKLVFSDSKIEARIDTIKINDCVPALCNP